MIQNEIKTMTDTIATLTDQLREQQRINNDQQVEIRRLQQQEVKTTKLQNAVNDLEARSRDVMQQTSTAGWLRSLISLISSQACVTCSWRTLCYSSNIGQS